jgi:RNA polymerase sigma factor (sigma-70 family)
MVATRPPTEETKMKLDKDLIDKAMAEGDMETLLSSTDTIIYFTLHSTGLWTRFPNYRDDFLQEGRLGILEAYKHWRKDDKASFTTYASIVVRNRIFSYIRGLKWLRDEVDYELNPDHVNLTYDMKPLTLYDTLVDEINKHEHKETLRLYFIEEHTQEEVSKMTGNSQQWVNATTNSFKSDMRIKYGKMFGINTTDERIKMYKTKTKRGGGDFYINDVLVKYAWYVDSKRVYTFVDNDDRVIAEISDCDKMSTKELIKKFGDPQK